MSRIHQLAPNVRRGPLVSARRNRRGLRTGRRLMLPVALAIILTLGVTAGGASATAASADHSNAPNASAIADLVRARMASDHLRAVIVKVTEHGHTVIRRAFGESLDGQPATPDMRFRNGATAFSYVAMLLLEFVDEHKVKLNDTIDHWMPTLPDANLVTLKMLANQTSGYPDFEVNQAWINAWARNPFHIWTDQEKLAYAFSRQPKMLFTPGTNWAYAHTNYTILGAILAQIGHAPLATLLQKKVLNPLGLTDTTQTETSDVPSPVLHTYSSERRSLLKIPPTVPFYEESTYWNTQWGTPIGANETSSIDDMVTSAAAVGTGKLLSKTSYHAMTDPNLLGFGSPNPACAPACGKQTNFYNYGLGVVRSGSWLLYGPALSGFNATEAYLPAQKIAISVAVTYLPGAFDSEGNYPNDADALFRSIGTLMAPGNPPPHR